MRLISYIAGLTIAIYLASGLGLFLMQDRMLLPSTPYAPDLRSVPHPGESIDVWRAHDQYAGYVVTPIGRPLRGTVIVYHGNEESAENKLPLADVFSHIGYRVIIAEYPGHGRRQGPRLMSAALTASRETLATALAKWGGPVYLVGESLGAGMASQVVQGNEAAIAGVVLFTPWDSLANVAAEKYPIFPVRWLLHNDFDSIAAVSHYRGPLVIVGAQEDTLIPVDHARHFANAHTASKLLLLPSANHDNWFDAMTRNNWQDLLQTLRAV
ncbi:alpha/beta hydrolase [Robbsia andropogonis]|uniref:alpha/beta hydrolase n=1 Tax=Robbsia andropogonis TaxID=28092 RepID=UPI0016430B18|nr:alpha/beta fold hydrolase [Robbsia andropogonis]